MPREKATKIEERNEEAPLSVEAPVVVPASIPEPESIQEPVVAFSKWFKVRGKERGFKPHWATGMQAYTDTGVPRSMTDWDEIFRAY
jgi:hypothetical protein